MCLPEDARPNANRRRMFRFVEFHEPHHVQPLFQTRRGSGDAFEPGAARNLSRELRLASQVILRHGGRPAGRALS